MKAQHSLSKSSPPSKSDDLREFIVHSELCNKYSIICQSLLCTEVAHVSGGECGVAIGQGLAIVSLQKGENKRRKGGGGGGGEGGPEGGI